MKMNNTWQWLHTNINNRVQVDRNNKVPIES